MKYSYLLPLLLLSLAGCSNSPAPPPYVPPPVPVAEPLLPAIPVPSVVLDTDAFIAQGRALDPNMFQNSNYRRTELDRFIRERSGKDSISILLSNGLRAMEAATTTLAVDYWVQRTKSARAEDAGSKLTSVGSQAETSSPAILERAAKAEAQMYAGIDNFAKMKYGSLSGNIPPTIAQNNMIAYRRRAERAAVQLDRLWYEELTGSTP